MKIYEVLVCMLALASIVSATSNTVLSDQGTSVRNISSGSLLESGDLTVFIYDAVTGGNLVYEEGFTAAIVNGSWNVMLGENVSLALTMNQPYWKDYGINGESVDFMNMTGSLVDRLRFYSPLGSVNATNLTGTITDAQMANQKLNISDQRYNDTAKINALNTSKAANGSCASGYVIQNATDTGVQCIAASAGVGTLGSVENATINALAENNKSINSTYGPYGASIAALVENNKSMNTSKANVGTCAAGTVVQNATATGVQCIATTAGVGTLGDVENATINALVENNKSINTTYGLYAASISALAANNASHNTTYGLYAAIIAELSENNKSMNATYGLYASSISTLAANNASHNATYGLYASSISTLSENNKSMNTTYGLYAASIAALAANNASHNTTYGLYSALLTALSENNKSINTSVMALIESNKSLNSTMTSWRSDSVGWINTTGNISTTRNVSVTDGLMLNTYGTQPACAAARRGTMWMNQSAAGITDYLWACMKNSTNSYNWVLVARGD